MPDEQIDIAAGEIPVRCACGAIYAWRFNSGEALPHPCCPSCARTDEDTDTDDDA